MKTLIKNAFIVDGSGDKGFNGELLFEDGKIVSAASAIPCEPDESIDAGSRVVCPGFTDMHRHCDAAVFKTGFGEPELAQGITSAVMGNCGITLVPCHPEARGKIYNLISACVGTVIIDPPVSTSGEYIQLLGTLALPINIGVFGGTGTTRVFVKGFSAAAFTGDEMAQAQRLLADALENGALGLSMGIMYAPECNGTSAEFAQMVAPLRGTGKPLAIHIRGEGNSMVRSIKEVLEIGRLADVSVHVSHFKAAGTNNWRKAVPEAIALIETARKSQDVTVDFYPYDCSSSHILSLIPPSFMGNDWGAAIASLSTSEGIAQFRAALEAEHDGWDNYTKMLGWERIVISSAKSHPEYAGKTIAELALPGDPVEFAARLILEENGKVAIIVRSMCQDDIDMIAQLPYASVISDSLYTDDGMPHPRLYGSFPKIIREYVNERRILSLEEAVKKMTSMPCTRMNLKTKGLLRPGYDADIIIFDKNEFRDNATFENSIQMASGLYRSIIGGKTVYSEQSVISRNCGKLLR